MTPVPRALAALACATGLLLTTPALASAADLVHTDPARDVRSGTIDGDLLRPAPAERRVDIRRVEVSHGAEALVVRFRTRGALPGTKVFLGARVRTPSATFDLTYLDFFGESGVSMSRGVDDVACEGLTATPEGRVVTFVVPSSCLGSPAWVRVGVGAAQMRHQRMVADDGFSRRQIGDDLHLSKRIARG
ncbi:hypothetical protein [Nocardioides daeguensis]|uniref:Uncharacterized protein n=1 Tax=Nocardioides daeguensis TaxID=908359 RepID=A0ABP6W960_9ACTN|nr:hypothetical protein [Nocardioides daeguensis]MBV6729609.1 hypothetical protein [Nocardioides daeguensis]MCR1775041.1 hypothetical protein [Nocardioides daeguensis]